MFPPLVGCEPPIAAPAGAIDILAAGARKAPFFIVDEGTGMPEYIAFPAGPSCINVVRRRASISATAQVRWRVLYVFVYTTVCKDSAKVNMT